MKTKFLFFAALMALFLSSCGSNYTIEELSNDGMNMKQYVAHIDSIKGNKKVVFDSEKDDRIKDTNLKLVHIRYFDQNVILILQEIDTLRITKISGDIHSPFGTKHTLYESASSNVGENVINKDRYNIYLIASLVWVECNGKGMVRGGYDTRNEIE